MPHRFARILDLAFVLVGVPAVTYAQEASIVRLSGCSITGGTIISPRAATSFALTAKNDSLFIDGVIIGRAQPNWRGFLGTRQQLVEPIRAGTSGYLVGSTIDTLFLQFDLKERVAWVHTLRVPLDTNNVVLVDRLDTHGGPPRVAGLLRLPAAIPLKGNCEEENFVYDATEAVAKVLKETPAIAGFIGLALPSTSDRQPPQTPASSAPAPQKVSPGRQSRPRR